MHEFLAANFVPVLSLILKCSIVALLQVLWNNKFMFCQQQIAKHMFITVLMDIDFIVCKFYIFIAYADEVVFYSF